MLQFNTRMLTLPLSTTCTLVVMLTEQVFYTSLFVYHLLLLFYRTLYPTVVPQDVYFGGNWKYLTHCNAILQICYFLYAGCLTVMKSESERCKRLRDTISACLVFPLGIFVGVMFWVLYHTDKNLVYNKDHVYEESSLFNHTKHTFIMVWAVLDLCYVHHVYPTNVLGQVLSACVSLSYMVWIHVVWWMSDFWVYPLLAGLGIGGRVMFCVGVMFFYQALYNVGKIANNFLYGKGKVYYHKMDFDV